MSPPPAVPRNLGPTLAYPAEPAARWSGNERRGCPGGVVAREVGERVAEARPAEHLPLSRMERGRGDVIALLRPQRPELSHGVAVDTHRRAAEHVELHRGHVVVARERPHHEVVVPRTGPPVAVRVDLVVGAT